MFGDTELAGKLRFREKSLCTGMTKSVVISKKIVNLEGGPCP